MKYDITVLTLISQGQKQHAKDEITFYDVGEHVLDVVAGSCKITLVKFMKLPEDTTAEAWNLKYRTVVREAGTTNVVSDTKLITFPGMDQRGMADFKLWAVEQLKETIEAVEAEMSGAPTVSKKRNVIMTALKMAWLWFVANRPVGQLNVR